MNQFGQVLEVQEDKATIKVRKHASCKSCGACGFLSKTDVEEVVLEAFNPIGAKKGEVVKVTAERRKVLLATLIVYVIPIIALVVAMYIGQQLAIGMGREDIHELVGIITGLGAMSAVFVGVRLVDKRIEKSQEFKPVIIEVVPEEEWAKFLEEG